MKVVLSVTIFLTVGSVALAQTDPIVIDEKYQDETRKLVINAQVKAAFAHIRELDSKTRKVHVDLTEIEAPPFLEEHRAIAFRDLLLEAGIDTVWIDEVGNVIGLRRGLKAERTVVLDAHLDTVFPKGTDVKVRIKGDTLMAPGIGDDTRGLAMLYTVLEALVQADIRTEANLLFVGTVGEEGLGDLRGVKHLFGSGALQIDSWISIDGGRLGRVNNQALGSYRFRVTFHGPGGHSWGAFGLVNPHHALGSTIDHFVHNAHALTSSGPRTSYNIGRVGGGTSINSIPFESWMEVDIRSVQPERMDTLESMLKEAVYRAIEEQHGKKRLGGDLTVTVEKIGDRPSGVVDPSTPLIQRALAATAFFGAVPKLTRGSTNANIPISKGLPAVTIGRGGVGAYAHSLDEWWVDRDGYKAIQSALLLLLAEAGLQ